MSAARQKFIDDVSAIRSALALDPLTIGSTGPTDPPAIVVLRRGILIAGFIALENFIERRAVELLNDLRQWPGSYGDLPQKFREASLLGAVGNLDSFATMMKRTGGDYQKEVIDEVALIAQNSGPVYGFSRHLIGDLSGNISATSIKDLLSSFCIKNCWADFRTLSADIGYGIPSMEELLRGLVRKRHRSAHAAGYAPSLVDTQSLALELTVLGLCFDASMSISVKRAITHWNDWKNDNLDWRSHMGLYFLDPHESKFRLSKHSAKKALKIVDDVSTAHNFLPTPAIGEMSIVVSRDAGSLPLAWRMVG